MKVRLYAKALLSMYPSHAKGGKDGALVDSLLHLLQKRGHQKLLQGIIRELKRASHQSMRGSDLVLSVASKSHEKRYHDDIVAAAKKLGKDSWITVEDPTLIGGFTLGTANAYMDRSYKHSLTSLFKKLV